MGEPHPYCTEHDQPLEWCAHHILTLFGKRVEVMLDDKGMVVTGTLLGFGEGGNFEILEDDGMIHYCWPALRVREVR